MAACDLCGNRVKAHALVQLLDSYKVAGVEDICSECEKWANKLKSDLLAEIAPKMREAVAAKATFNTAPKKKAWWKL